MTFSEASKKSKNAKKSSGLTFGEALKKSSGGSDLTLASLRASREQAEREFSSMQPKTYTAPTTSPSIPAVGGNGQWVSTGAGRKSTLDYDAEMSRLENLRRQAAVDLDTSSIVDIDRQMKELRAQFGRQTGADRASDIFSTIVSGSASDVTNIVGLGAQAYNDPDKYQRDIDRLQKVLDTGKTSDGKTITAAQRKGVEQSIAELKEKKAKAESETSAHNRIYKVADQMDDDSAKFQQQAKQGLGATGQMLVDAGTSFGQSMLTGAVGAVTGTGMLPFAVTAFGGATQDARRNGANLSEQLMYGAAQAGKEYLTEKLFGIALPQKIAGATGSFDDVMEKGLRKAVEKYFKSEVGQRVAGGIGTWLLGGVTEGLEEAIGSVIENIVINPNLRNFDPDTRTSEEKWEEMWYSAIVGGISGLLGVTNLVSYNPSQTAVSPASDPVVQQAQVQAEATKQQNPEVNVLDAATTLFVNEQGCNLKTAEIRAGIVQKLIAGEEVSDKDLKRIEPTSKVTQRIFTQLTGVQFPEGPAGIEKLMPVFRSAHEVAVQAQQAQVAQQETPAVRGGATQKTIDNTEVAANNIIKQTPQQETDGGIGSNANTLNTVESGESIRVITGGVLTRDQFNRFMRELAGDEGKTITDQQLDALFTQFKSQEQNGLLMPYHPIMDKLQKEVVPNGRVDAGAETGDSGEAVERRADEGGDRDARRSEGSTRPDSRGRVQSKRAEKKARLLGRKIQSLGRLSGLENPRTRKVKIPGVAGYVQAVYRADYTEQMQAAHELARELGYRLVVTTKRFNTSLLDGFDSVDGLMDPEAKIITVSAKATKNSDFWTTFKHELFHVFADNKKFMVNFIGELSAEAKLEGLTSANDVHQFLLDEIQENEYLADYRRKCKRDKLGLQETELELLNELCAELFAGTNEYLQLDEDTYNVLHEAAVKVFSELSEEYEGDFRAEAQAQRQQKYYSEEESVDGREELPRREGPSVRESLERAETGQTGERGTGVHDEGVYRTANQRTGQSDGSVQETRRGTETGDGGRVEAGDSSSREVRLGGREEAHGVGSQSLGPRGRGESGQEGRAEQALNIDAGKAEIPTFKSWNDAFLYFEFGAGQDTGLSFGDPPSMADEMVIGQGKPWKPIKVYPKSQDGMSRFQADLPRLLSGEDFAETTDVDTVETPDFVGKKHIDAFAEKRKNAEKMTVDGVEYEAVNKKDYTGAMRKIEKQARKLGFDVSFVYGSIITSYGREASGLTSPDSMRILVSVDGLDYLRTARHELFHARCMVDPTIHKRVLDRIEDAGLTSVFRETYDTFTRVWSGYEDALLDPWTYKYKVENEVLAEAFSKSYGHDARVRNFVDIVQNEVTAWDSENENTLPRETGKVGNPDLDVLREWYGEELDGYNLADLSDEFEDFSDSYNIDNLKHSPVGESVLNQYLAQIEEAYGADFAKELSAAFYDLDLSRQAAQQMAEATPAVGAAELGFDPYSNLQNKYGTVEPGENPAHVIDMPAQTKDNNKVSLTPRTVMEAKATPESRIPTIEDAVVDHKFSYIEGHNKIQINRAVAKLKKDGWEDTLSNWTRDVRDGKVNADLVAMGAVMLNNAGNSDMGGARYTQLLVDYTNLLRSAGQATQAARILKNLTPEARLYGLHGYANQMNDRIRKDDPAHNIPVEKWMEVTGNLLAKRLKQVAGGSRKQAKTTAQTILSDLNAFAREAFPEQEKAPGRTEMERLQDLFDNYENYREAWEAAKETLRTEYADKPEALEAFEKFLQTDLAEAFLGRYFNHPEVRIDGALSQEFLDAKTDEERDAVIDRIIEDIARQIPATRMEKFTALRYLNMLGNFKTQGRNILGNTANLGLTKVKNQVATFLEVAVNAMGGNVERTKSYTKDKATYQAALKDFEKMQEIVLSGGKYQDGRRFDERIEEKRTIFKNKVLEGYRKATNWAMTQGDLVFSKVAYADALAGYLTAHGKTFETAGDSLMEQARAYAVQQAAEATFRDSNMFSDAISGMRFKNPDTLAKRAINTIAEGLMPFRKTPANILVRAVEYSPVGILTTAAEAMYGKRITGSVNGSKLIDSLAKNITGTGLVVIGYVLANSGLLKGAASDDEKEKAFEDLTGHQAYSIELPNGMSLTLDWLAPSSIPLFLGAQIAETAAEEGMTVRTALDAIGSITDPMLQMSMLQGLDDALSNASTYGDDSALVRFTGNALWSFMTQGLTNTMLGQLERSLKNERSTTYRDKNKDLPDGLQYLVGKTLEKTPFVDYGQIPYIDAWGRTETNAKTDFGNVFTQFASPSYVSWVEESDMEKELQRLFKATGESSVLISRPKSYFNVDTVRKDLTAEEFVEYATTRGQTAYVVTTDLTESAIYETLTEKQKAAAVEKAYDFANQLAKATVTGYDPSKWDGDVPEGAVGPDKWVKNAAQDAAEYGISVGDYVALYAATKDIESFTNDKGETVDNSKSLKLAVAIYDLGMSEAQTEKIMEDFGVNKTVRGYSEKMARRKLEAMKGKYE